MFILKLESVYSVTRFVYSSSINPLAWLLKSSRKGTRNLGSDVGTLVDVGVLVEVAVGV
jgi:hypothetical protein